MKPEFDAIRTKTLSELEEDLEQLLEDSKQKTPLLNCTYIAESSLRKKKSKASFKKTTRKKKQSRSTISNINDIDEKIKLCLQKAEDIFSINTSRRILHLMDSQLCRTRTRSSFHQISWRIGWTNSWRWTSWLVTWHWPIHGRIKQSRQTWSSLGAVQSKGTVG